MAEYDVKNVYSTLERNIIERAIKTGALTMFFANVKEGTPGYDPDAWGILDYLAYEKFRVYHNDDEGLWKDIVTLPEFAVLLRGLPESFLKTLSKHGKLGILDIYIQDNADAWNLIFEKAKVYFEVVPAGKDIYYIKDGDEIIGKLFKNGEKTTVGANLDSQSY